MSDMNCTRCHARTATKNQRWCRQCFNEHARERRAARRRGDIAITEVMAKLCLGCARMLPTVAFNKHMGRVDGLTAICRDCAKTRGAKYLKGTRREPALILTDVEAAYIAGLVDGEGSIRLRQNGDQMSDEMNVTNTDRAVLDWLRERLGGHVVVHAKAGPRHRQSFRWIATTLRARAILRRLLPYLKVKHRHAEALLAFREAIPAYKLLHRGGVRLPLDDPLKSLLDELNRLNRRGPRPDLPPSP